MIYDVVFDIETDSFKQKGGPRQVHCAEVAVAQTGEQFHFADQPGYLPLSDLIDLLQSADRIIAHNGLAFDIPVLERLYGVSFKRERIIDTLIAARSAFSDIRDRDDAENKVPANLRGKHSLEAWGHRLGIQKGDFGKTCDWTHWSPQMSRYCELDAVIGWAVYAELLTEADSQGVPFWTARHIA